MLIQFFSSLISMISLKYKSEYTTTGKGLLYWSFPFRQISSLSCSSEQLFKPAQIGLHINEMTKTNRELLFIIPRNQKVFMFWTCRLLITQWGTSLIVKVVSVGSFNGDVDGILSFFDHPPNPYSKLRLFGHLHNIYPM